MKHDPHTDCPFCWSKQGANYVIQCPLCWQTRHVPVALAVEFNLMGLPAYFPALAHSGRWRDDWLLIKRKLRALRGRHGLKTEKWK